MSRVLSVPLDKDTMQYFRDNSIDVYFNEDDFLYIWLETNLFHDINDELDIIIDAHELDKVIGQENLRKLLSIAEEYEFEYNFENPFISTLKSLTEVAIHFDTGVFFDF